MMKIYDGCRILFIGDSITDIKFNRKFNRRLHGKNIYALQAATELKKHYSNLKLFYRGIASDRTYSVYDRLTKDCISLKPDIVIMLIGVNDAWEHYVPEQYPPLKRPAEPHMREIYRRINTELDGAQVLYLTPFLIDTVYEKSQFHTVLNEYIKSLSAIAEESGAQVINLQEIFYAAQKEYGALALATDGIHPTDLGHKVIADAVLKKLLEE